MFLTKKKIVVEGKKKKLKFSCILEDLQKGTLKVRFKIVTALLKEKVFIIFYDNRN